jgi:hypothetical protein
MVYWQAQYFDFEFLRFPKVLFTFGKLVVNNLPESKKNFREGTTPKIFHKVLLIFPPCQLRKAVICITENRDF